MNINVETPMLRPSLMVRAARLGAQNYRRERDLSGAVSGLLARPEDEILPTLRQRESQLETMRRQAKPGYRPARHLQVLAALIAEARDAGVDLDDAEPRPLPSGSSNARTRSGCVAMAGAIRRTRRVPRPCAAE